MARYSAPGIGLGVQFTVAPPQQRLYFFPEPARARIIISRPWGWCIARISGTTVIGRVNASRAEWQQGKAMNDTVKDTEILTLRDVAKILRCATNKVYELTRGRAKARMDSPLPVFKIHSKMTRIRKADLMKWLDEMIEKQRSECLATSHGETKKQRDARQKREATIQRK